MSALTVPELVGNAWGSSWEPPSWLCSCVFKAGQRTSLLFFPMSFHWKHCKPKSRGKRLCCCLFVPPSHQGKIGRRDQSLWTMRTHPSLPSFAHHCVPVIMWVLGVWYTKKKGGKEDEKNGGRKEKTAQLWPSVKWSWPQLCENTSFAVPSFLQHVDL